MTIGENIRKKRIEKGYSQEYLGKKLGVSQNAIHKLESGKKEPNISEVFSLSEILEVPISEIIGRSINQEFNNCKDCGHLNPVINHHFPKELMEILKKISEKI
jgi:transcriptional regulator with XRE-family HTH domain